MTEVIKGAALTAEVDAARGAKIISIRDARGQEWLAQAGDRAVASRSFINSEMAGWDECAPTIDPCVVDGRDIPDHGDLWNSQFALTGDTARGVGDGYLFERTIERTAGGLTFAYRVDAGRKMPFLWAAHPQFSAPSGTRVVLPRYVRSVLDVTGLVRRRRGWTNARSAIDDVAPGRSRKYQLHAKDITTAAALVRPDGSALKLTWSDTCPYLGIWFDRAQWSREPVIAIEPSTGFFDSLERASRLNRVTRIQPGTPLKWRLDVEYLENWSDDQIN